MCRDHLQRFSCACSSVGGRAAFGTITERHPHVSDARGLVSGCCPTITITRATTPPAGSGLAHLVPLSRRKTPSTGGPSVDDADWAPQLRDYLGRGRTRERCSLRAAAWTRPCDGEHRFSLSRVGDRLVS